MKRTVRMKRSMTTKRTLRLTPCNLVLVFGLMSWAGCQTANYGANRGEYSQASARPLTQDEAAQRAQQISNTDYQLSFYLDADSISYEGSEVLAFDLNPHARAVSSDLFIDFNQGKLEGVSINGIRLTERQISSQYDGDRLRLAIDQLKAGRNRLAIRFRHGYSSEGTGLHHFRDPVDGLTYLYSNFEPFDAHRMFPCFDQPDLKATFELTVEAPRGWTVIANTAESVPAGDSTHGSSDRVEWKFPATARISTYLFALHAGPYHSWKSQVSTHSGHLIPLRLFARQSIARYVEAAEWLKITQQGLRFYNRQFGIEYPFGKYDQIIVPDFNAGAMENVAAVTFSERYVNRARTTRDRHRGRANTILHEMAHMWFGDLVTMKWWDGLWLNESFATFMSSWAVDQATEFKGSWEGFFSGSKIGAYTEDQWVTSHPVQGVVQDTAQAFANFDSITYGKGASTLKQLKFWLGDEVFLKGLRKYFRTYAYGNTTTQNFFESFSDSAHDLKNWESQWIETKSVNTVEAKWSCASNKIKDFSLLQRASDMIPLLRRHKTRVGLYQIDSSGHMRLASSSDVEYSGIETSVPTLVGQACPSLVYPNQDDFDYVKVDLDSVSVEAAKTSLSKIPSSFARQLIWQSLWQMVRDARIPAQTYLTIVTSQLGHETNTVVLSQVLRTVVQTQAGSASALLYLAPGERVDFSDRLETFLKNNRDHSVSGSDPQLIWHSTFLALVHSAHELSALKSVLAGRSKIHGIALEQDRRWEILEALARNHDSDAQSLIEAEKSRDATDMGHKEAIRASAAFTSADSKDRWFAILAKTEKGGASYKYSEAREAMWSFQNFGHEFLTSRMREDYFKVLPEVVKTESEEYSQSFTTAMYPSLCDAGLADQTGQFLDHHPGLPPSITKALRIHQQEEERCARARLLSSSGEHHLP